MTKKLRLCGCSGATAKVKSFVGSRLAGSLSALFILAVSLLLVSCRTVQPICTITKTDSVFFRDSVFINNFERVVDSVRQNGDTIHHYHTKYIFKELGRVQEQNIVSKDSVNYVPYLEKKPYKSNDSFWFWAFIFLLSIIVAYAFGVKRSHKGV